MFSQISSSVMDTLASRAAHLSYFSHVAVLIALGIGFTADAAMAQAESDRRTISVSGEGTVRVEPDMARVNFGVVTVSDNPETARRENAEAARSAMNAIRELGIEERFIRLEVLRLQPNRVFDEESRRYVEKGFEATRQVVVEVHDLEKLPTLIAEIVQKGANRLNSVGYELKDRDKARNDAIREAVLNARDKARLIATTLGEELGEIRQVNEQSFDFPRPIVRMESLQMASKDAADAEPDAYAAGELEVRVNVHTVFSIQE